MSLLLRRSLSLLDSILLGNVEHRIQGHLANPMLVVPCPPRTTNDMSETLFLLCTYIRLHKLRDRMYVSRRTPTSWLYGHERLRLEIRMIVKSRRS